MTKRLLCRILSLALFALMLLQAMPVWASESRVFSLQLPFAENSEFYFQASAVDFGKSHLYYDQLTDDHQRILYKNLLEATPATGMVEMVLTDIPEFILPNEGLTPELQNQILAYLQEITSPAYAAAILDTPQLFWAKGVGGNVTFEIIGNKITKIYLHCTIDHYPQYDQSTYEITLAALTEKLNSLTFDSTQGTYSLLKQFHDYLCENTVYVDSANAHNIAGPLLDGESVCEGYAKGFKLFCDLYGIPCMVVTGDGVTNTGSEPHAWNVVRMEDGAWYAVDVTWDDQPDQIYYDFFLSGGDTVPTYFYALSFNESHRVENDLYGNGATIFAAPPLSNTAYTPEENHEHAYSASIVNPTCTVGGYTTYTCLCGDTYVADETNPLGHSHQAVVTDPTCIEGGYTTYTCLVCHDTYSSDFSDALGHEYTSGVCERCGESDPDAPTVTIGDVNGDGKINIADYALVKRSVLRTYTLLDQQETAADVNKDGKINVADYALLKRFVMGTLEHL